ncbi:Protein of unknown function [Fontimonas thermophila]|uniref:DUF1302 domain-containing protein n=1 Tax=Fontimonas thermophila TaxID=1076937 RepID=A0A1I2HE17_9GAMM|nr:DUF1302 family protein [Fontimonas thermophila]SFF26791.1 Protein of unknown function [Fontimonas thermophila]
MARRSAVIMGCKSGAKVLCFGAAMLQAPAWAGSFDLFAGIEGTYKLTTTYSLAVRMQKPHGALIDGPVDPFQSVVYIPPEFGQTIGFIHTGLPTTINLDDGNRAFERYSPINNRLSAFYEVQLRRENLGAVVSGTAFYDRVFHEKNDRDPVNPDDPNDYGPNTFECSADRVNCDHNRFTDGARYYNGRRSRLLEAYVYGDFMLTDEIAVNVRFGKHLVAWGESLFFPGIVSAQGPNDATKAFVPGAEIKEILLPVHQISATIAFGYDLSVMGYYQLDYKPTEVFPVGDFFSVADVVGPGAQMAYGSGNPAYADNCPGLLAVPGTGIDLSFLCLAGGGIGGSLINAPRTIDVPRLDDIRPDDDGQWGVGAKYQLTPQTSVGAYYIRYHNHNPTVNLNFGFAFIGELGGQPITTEIIQQSVPVSYNVKYFGDIEMIAGSWSTTLFGLNLAGDLIFRNGVDVSAAAEISGVLSPVFTRAETYQANVSSLFVANPKFAFYDEIAIVSEVAYLYVDKVDPIEAKNGQRPRGNGTALFYDRNAWAYQILMLPKGRNVFPGWDIGTPIAFAHAANGYASTAGTFGALFGEGDKRVGLSITAQYLQNLEFAIGYNWFLGNPRRLVRDSPIPANPVTDRDYATFSIKYNL